MTTEEMRSVWNRTPEMIGNFGTRNSGFNDGRQNRKTSLDRLKRNYRVFGIIALVMIFVSFNFFRMPDMNEKFRVTITIIMMAYFAVCSVMDYWLYSKVSEIDVFRMTVREIAAIACLCRRRHRQFVLVIIPIAIVVVYFLLFVSIDSASLRIGGITGGIIGGAIGIRKYIEIMGDYRVLSKREEDE